MSTRAPEFTSISTAVLQPRLPRIGNIKLGGLGAERTSGSGTKYRLPQKYDHIRVTKRARDDSGNFVLDSAVHKLIGEKPRHLDVVLMFNEIEHNWQTSFVAYDGKKLRCQGNGERAFDRVLGREIPCTCPLLKVHEGKYEGPARPTKLSCKPYGVLSVLLPDADTYGGFYVFRTTSWEMISSITASLQLFRQQFGGLAFLPLRIELNPVLDTYEEGGKTKTSTTWKASLVLAGSIDTAFQLAAGAQERRVQLLQLSAGTATYTPEQHVETLREIAAEDEGSIADEYYSETAAGGDVQDADFEIEEESDEDQQREDLCRLALEYLDWSKIRVNNQIAKYAGDMAGLVAKLEEEIPDAMAQARAEQERIRGDSGDDMTASDEAEPDAEQEGLF